ncbi:MAG: hypothetical protein WCP60_05215 [bacterium]
MSVKIQKSSSMAPGRRPLQYAILGGLVAFALALCALVVVMMLNRGPAVAY